MDVTGIIKALERRVPVDEDTYIGAEDLLYCSRCNTPRQSRIDVLGNIRVVPCVCKCMKEQMERDEAERERQKQIQEIRRFRSMGFPDRELIRFTFENDDGARPELTKAMKAYVEHFPKLRREGKGLLLYGNVGTGKSFLAACVVNALIDKGYPCLMTNFSRLTNELAGMWEGKQEYLDGLGRFALVAIDDLGVERDTEYMNENVTTIIDCLYRSNVPIIITSNYTPKQLTEDCEIRKRRVYDRLLERCHPVKVDGASRRKEKGRDDYNDMKALLGV